MTSPYEQHDWATSSEDETGATHQKCRSCGALTDSDTPYTDEPGPCNSDQEVTDA